MAEIKIEKEKTVWPWILLGILLVGLLLYFLVFRNNDHTGETASVADTVQSDTDQINRAAMNNTGPVAEYMAYINGEQAMGLDHNYTHGALTRLADAIEAKARETDYTVQSDLDRVKNLADEIKKDPMSLTHANSIRKAAGILTTALHNIQQAKYPDLGAQAQEVKTAADAIDPDVQTLNQKEEVKTFFDKAAQVLQQMN